MEHPLYAGCRNKKDLCCREAGSHLRANAVSLFGGISVAQGTQVTSAQRPWGSLGDLGEKALGTHWEFPIGHPDSLPLDNTADGSPQVKRSMHGTVLYSSNKHLIRGRWHVWKKSVLMGEEDIIIIWDDTILGRDCPWKQLFSKKGWKVHLGLAPWNKKSVCKISTSKS